MKYFRRCISCFLIWITLTVWIVKAAVEASMDYYIENIALDLIEALQGIFALLIFVSDRYTRKELKGICRKSSTSRPEQVVETELTTLFGPNKRNETTNY